MAEMALMLTTPPLTAVLLRPSLPYLDDTFLTAEWLSKAEVAIELAGRLTPFTADDLSVITLYCFEVFKRSLR